MTRKSTAWLCVLVGFAVVLACAFRAGMLWAMIRMGI